MKSMITETIFLKNMSCTCCIRLIQQEMENMGVRIDDVKLGEITIRFEHHLQLAEIHRVLEQNGLEIVVDKEEQTGDLTLSEIVYMMAYSSVQYLSTQFKSVTGVSVSDYKKDPAKYRKLIDSLIE
ncbi:MAG: hypothetical protein U9R60_15735 [Bacteroidota bacterium]|nr:hypothetical protein [Bacteroidota bacterium]